MDDSNEGAGVVVAAVVVLVGVLVVVCYPVTVRAWCDGACPVSTLLRWFPRPL